MYCWRRFEEIAHGRGAVAVRFAERRQPLRIAWRPWRHYRTPKKSIGEIGQVFQQGQAGLFERGAIGRRDWAAQLKDRVAATRRSQRARIL
jgi:hypothetical protein